MKKINSLIYLLYYLLLWVVLPSTGLGEQVFESDIGSRDQHGIRTSDANFSDFQHCVNPDWNRVNRQESPKDGLSGTGHWPILFSAVFKPQFRFAHEVTLSRVFSNVPIVGALTVTKIIYPFHYFW